MSADATEWLAATIGAAAPTEEALQEAATSAVTSIDEQNDAHGELSSGAAKVDAELSSNWIVPTSMRGRWTKVARRSLTKIDDESARSKQLKGQLRPSDNSRPGAHETPSRG